MCTKYLVYSLYTLNHFLLFLLFLLNFIHLWLETWLTKHVATCDNNIVCIIVYVVFVCCFYLGRCRDTVRQYDSAPCAAQPHHQRNQQALIRHRLLFILLFLLPQQDAAQQLHLPPAETAQRLLWVQSTDLGSVLQSLGFFKNCNIRECIWLMLSLFYSIVVFLCSAWK